MEDRETPEERFGDDDDADLESLEPQGDAGEAQMAEAAIIPEASPEEEDQGDTAAASEDSGGDQEDELEVNENPERGNMLSGLWQKLGMPLFQTVAQRHLGVSLGVTLGIVLVVGSSVLKWELSKDGSPTPPPPVQTYVTPAVSELTEIVSFKRFVLFPSGMDKAYVSVGISARTRNEEVYREIRGREAWYRSLVYDILTEALKDQGFPDSDREEVGKRILHALNAALGRDGVEEIVFGDLLEV